MTRERTKELLPYMTAFAEGKTIQSRLKINGMCRNWIEVEHPNWNADVEWRTKPEPRKFYLVECEHSKTESFCQKLIAEVFAKGLGCPYEIIETVEVVK